MKKLVSAMIVLWSLIGLMIVAVLITSMTGYKKEWSSPFSVFNRGNMELLVDENIPSNGLNAVNIELSSDICEVYLTDGGSVNIKHYGRGLSADMYVKISEDNGELTASTKNRQKPFGFSFNDYSRIEIYLPRSYAEKLNIGISSGTLAFEDEMALSALNVDLRSGTIRAERKISAAAVGVSVNSGTIKLSGGLDSDVYSIRARSGTISVDGLTGSGSVEANSGTIRLSGVDIKESLKAATSSGTISIGIVGEPGFKFTGKKSSGTIRTYFGNFSDGDISVTTGEAPYKSLDVRVNSGTVRITQE